MMAPLPTFIGIGAPKAGTTWLANALAEHPEVCFASVKEPDFFAYRFVDTTIETYSELFVPSSATRAIGEFSTRYLSDYEVPGRVARVLPDVQLLVCLRNPVDQMYSNFWHLQRQNFHEWDATLGTLSFEEALERFEERLVEPAYYARHLRRWREHFAADRFCIELFDDIRSAPEEVLRRVYTFVGVDPDYVPGAANRQSSGERRGTSPRSGRAAHWGARLYNTLNTRVYHPLKSVVGVDRAGRLKDALRVRQLLERLFRQPGYPPMNPETRARLTEQFREPNRELTELIGRDLSRWDNPAKPRE